MERSVDGMTLHREKYSGDFIPYYSPELFQGCEKPKIFTRKWTRHLFHPDQKQNSWTYNFVEVSGPNLDSSQTGGCIYNVYNTNQFKPLFIKGAGGGGVKSVSRGNCE